MVLVATTAVAQLAVPAAPTRRINDYAGALSPAERERLELKLVERERSTSNQIVVAVFPSLRGENLEDYSVRLAQAWRVGQKGLDNGVVFLIFLEDRKMRLEVGYGLEATLTDAIAASIVRDVIVPPFREGRLAGGIEAGLDSIAAAIGGTYGRPERSAWKRLLRDEQTRFSIPLSFVMLLVFITVAVSGANRARRRRGWTGGPAGWSGGGSGWSGGGSFSSSSSSGSFSGGGGSFGGGGASGSW